MNPSDTDLTFWRTESGAEDTRSPNASRGSMREVNRGASGLRPSLAALLKSSDVSCEVPLSFRLSFHLGLMLVALSLLVGCGHKHQEGDGHDHGKQEAHGKDDGHGHGHGEESPSGASFKEGKGITLTDETRDILGVEVADATEQKLPVQIRFHVQVFSEKHHHAIREDDHTGCDAHGSGFVPLDQSAALSPGQSVQIQTRDGETLHGVVLAVEKALSLGESEIIVGVTNATDKLKPGDFLPTVVTLPRKESVTVIPRSALLRTSEGTFVYAVNGDAYFRTAVKVGSEAGGLLEITDGLFAGDAVVTKPVETFYLIELRATKGGGHSH